MFLITVACYFNGIIQGTEATILLPLFLLLDLFCITALLWHIWDIL